MGWYYSLNTGLQETDFGDETPELAIIQFYKKELHKILDEKQSLEQRLEQIDKRLGKFKEMMKEYVDAYPEEFI